MSSHHFVRDKQEPALLIANGASCSDALLGQLLEWNPFVLALDGALPRLMAQGIKVDVVLGDFDSIPTHLLTNQEQHYTLVSAPSQDQTDLEKGLDYLVANGFGAVHILWATGRRADHHFANLTNIVKYKDKIIINLLDDYARIFILPPKFEKWYPAQTILSLMPIGRVEGITTHNLAYPLHNDWLEIGKRIGTSNHALATGWVKIEHTNGHLLLAECFDEAIY